MVGKGLVNTLPVFKKTVISFLLLCALPQRCPDPPLHSSSHKAQIPNLGLLWPFLYHVLPHMLLLPQDTHLVLHIPGFLTSQSLVKLLCLPLKPFHSSSPTETPSILWGLLRCALHLVFPFSISNVPYCKVYLACLQPVN